MKQISFLHLYLTKQLADSCNSISNLLKRKKALNIIYFSRIPAKYKHKILNNLEEDGLIETVNRKNIKINKEKIKQYDDWF